MVIGAFRRGTEDAFRRNRRAGVLQIEYHEILLVRRTPILGDAALRVIGDCDGAAPRSDRRSG